MSTHQIMAWRRGFYLAPPPYYRELLVSARSLCDRGDHTLAVITAFMACELLTEQAMGWMYEVRGAGFLEAPVAEFIASYNLANERVRRLQRIEPRKYSGHGVLAGFCQACSRT